jgi:pimeloyl-ACP methyl ester carboxylesterase
MTDAPDAAPPSILELPGGGRLAYHRTAGAGPGVVFLGGFASDMTGTKATALEAWARRRGRAFLRFDYRGHGQSSGRFEDGTIGAWRDDALAALDRLTDGPQILVGSSMGGWIMLLAALARPERVAGLVGIAPAPDFTEDLMWARMTEDQQRAVEQQGVWHMPSDYGDPVPIARDLIREGRDHLLLRDAIELPCPVRLIQGTEDEDVPWQWALKLQDALAGDDVETTLVKGADHRLSSDRDLRRLEAVLDRLSGELSPGRSEETTS